MSSSRGSSHSRDRTRISCVFYIGRQVLYYQHHLGSPIIRPPAQSYSLQAVKDTLAPCGPAVISYLSYYHSLLFPCLHSCSHTLNSKQDLHDQVNLNHHSHALNSSLIYPCLCCQFNSWVGRIPWRRKWHPTPVLLLGKSRGRRILVGYSPWGHKRVRHD